MDIPSNPAKIDWPTDKAGITGRLKREGCRAIGRISGDSDNLDIVMNVLRILAQHAKDKLAEQQAIHKGNLVMLADRRAESEVKNDNRYNAMERSLKTQAETLKNRLASLQKRKDDTIKRSMMKVKEVGLAEERRTREGIGGGQKT